MRVNIVKICCFDIFPEPIIRERLGSLKNISSFLRLNRIAPFQISRVRVNLPILGMIPEIEKKIFRMYFNTQLSRHFELWSDVEGAWGRWKECVQGDYYREHRDRHQQSTRLSLSVSADPCSRDASLSLQRPGFALIPPPPRLFVQPDGRRHFCSVPTGSSSR